MALPIQLESTVELVEPMGSDTLVWATVAGERFRIRVDGQTEIRSRDPIRIGFSAAQASFFDAASELRM